MKLLIGAAAAALMFAATAAAQTPPTDSAHCSGFQPAPTLPDGATADRAEIAVGNTQYETWGQERLAKLRLCRAEIEALRAQLAPLEQAYTANNTELTSVVTAWQAEVAEFNARGGATRNRRGTQRTTRPN